MVDYDFYVNSYLGSAIPETAFSGMVARAQQALNRFKRIYQVVPCGDTSEKMALCAMAETAYSGTSRKDGVLSATVGGVSVRYESSLEGQRALDRAMFRQARVYLDFYRGVAR
jgi:hypothetical protein